VAAPRGWAQIAAPHVSLVCAHGLRVSATPAEAAAVKCLLRGTYTRMQPATLKAMLPHLVEAHRKDAARLAAVAGASAAGATTAQAAPSFLFAQEVVAAAAAPKQAPKRKGNRNRRRNKKKQQGQQGQQQQQQ
jgi:hypothetical protein